ncbi:MAG: ABC transporter ATP-binding protein [Ruminococcus sp.]|nr:ABC transporter ATP-binding protein [Ruminococcus sp.]
MASLTLENLTKTYPNGFHSVKNISLEIKDGEIVILQGPSGCGKSTILRMIGGLEDVTSGEIHLGSTLLNDVLPCDRPLAMLFQNYAMYPHLNVYENMALGLKLRNMPRNIIDSRVKSTADFLGIGKLLDKKNRSVSEADKQKVALGRAIVCKPKVMLVDEDFAHGNPGLRGDLLHYLQKINQEYHTTILYATRTPGESCGLGGKTVLLKSGEIENIIPA